MTKVRVLSKFHDRADYKHVFEVGEVVDFTDLARVRSIVERGLGEIVVDEPKPQEEKVTGEKPKASTAGPVEPVKEVKQEVESPKPEMKRKAPTRKKKNG